MTDEAALHHAAKLDRMNDRIIKAIDKLHKNPDGDKLIDALHAEAWGTPSSALDIVYGQFSDSIKVKLRGVYEKLRG